MLTQTLCVYVLLGRILCTCFSNREPLVHVLLQQEPLSTDWSVISSMFCSVCHLQPMVCVACQADVFYVRIIFPQVDSAFHPSWDGKMSTSQRAVMLCSWEGNCRLGGSNGSLLPGGWLIVTCGLTACTPGSAPAQRLVTSMGSLYLYLLSILVLASYIVHYVSCMTFGM